MSEKYDAVIVGAGCAGLLAASRIAAAGNSVLVLDRRREEELGLGGHDLVGLEELKSAGLDASVASDGSEVSSIRVLSPDAATRLTLSADPFVMVSRSRLAVWLLEQARTAGAKVMTQCIAGEAVVERGRVTGVGSDRGTFSCSLALGTSGIDRVLCRDLPGGMGIPRLLKTSDYMSIYREVRNTGDGGEEMPAGTLEYHVGRYGGYSWTYSPDGGAVEIGTAVQDVAGSPDPRDIVLGYVRSRPAVGEKALLREGGRIPARRPLNTMVASGLMIAGDAACQAAPVIARGVGGALTGGALAGAIAAKALSAGDVSIASLWPYNYRYMRTRGADMAALDCLRILLQNMAEKDVAWSMAKGVIDQGEIASALAGRFEGPTAQTKLRSLFKGISGTPLLMRYDKYLRLSQKVSDHYMAYPREYDAPEFADWAQQADFLFEDIEKNR